MNDFLTALEETRLSLFIRESSSFLGFPMVLTMHTIGLSLILGPNVIVCMRMLGLIPGIPLKPLRKLFPFMWTGLLLTVVSGAALVMAAAHIRVPNPILWVKLVLIAVASPIMFNIQKKVLTDPELSENALPPKVKNLAWSQLSLWLLILVAGRLIAYSATILGEGY